MVERRGTRRDSVLAARAVAGATALLLTTALVSTAIFGPTPAARAQDANVQRHVDAARAAAGSIWQRQLQQCALPTPQTREGPIPARLPASSLPPADRWAMEPLKIFDNLYFVGSKNVAAFAIKTSDGLIVTDGMWDYDFQRSVVEGLQKLGLDPKDIKYIIVPHGHPDHYGGAVMVQARYGTKVIWPGGDLAFAKGRYGDARVPFPTPDRLIKDGDKVVLGDTTVTVIQVSGHTPAGVNLMFPVTDHGRRHMALIWSAGASIPDDPDGLRASVQPTERLIEMARRANADVMLQNHGSQAGVEQLRAHPEGPNPFLVGVDGVVGFLKVRSECAQARLGLLGK